MFFKFFFVCFLVTLSSAASSKSDRRRFSPLSFFNLVSQEECQLHENGHSFNGTCYSRSECLELGGQPKGECADGYGVCCVFYYSCGNYSQTNVSYFVNPNFPHNFNEPASCTLKVKKIDKQICQIRLDFEQFDILGPTEFGPLVNLKQTGSSFGSINSESNCKDDLFVVTQSNRNQPIPIICGHNTGHHMFVPVEESDGEAIAITFLTGIKDFQRNWIVKITQLSCSLSQDYLAPQGCLQYFTSAKGFIKTFNFEGQKYIQNIDYSVCIRKPKNMCYLTLNTVKHVVTTTSIPDQSTIVSSELPSSPSTPDPIPSPVFPFINESSSSSSTVVMGGRFIRFAGDDFCLHDGYWITWPGSNKICSNDIEVLESPITISTNAPEVLHFHSLTWNQALQFNVNKFNTAKGFSVNYAHAPCTHGFL